jgi:hypothetical protein
MLKKISLFFAMGALLALSANKMSAQTVILQGNMGSLMWELTSDSVLTITGSGAMQNYTLEDGSPWGAEHRTQIKSAIIGNSVTTIGDWVFSECYNLASVTIPNSIMTIGEGAFDECYNLISVTIPNSVTMIGDGAFGGCRSLTSVTIPNSVKTIGGWAFYDCNSLTSITIPNSITTIEKATFSHCNSLTSIMIPDSVTMIGDEAFSHCDRLTSVTIPNTVTTIGEWAFFHCNGLTSVTIGNSVTMLGEYVFGYCSGLTEIINLNPTPIAINANVFEGVNKPTCVLKVPAGSLSAYRAANVWKDFLNIEEISVSIAEVQHTAPLQIYPNPVANGEITLSNGEGKAEIYTVQGVRVGDYRLTDKETIIHVSHLANGMYFVKVGNTVRKLIVGK